MIEPGTIIGHIYRVESQIGSGGMASVYRALNLANRRYYAIKILKEEFATDAEFLRRFQREAKAALHLSHENIVQAYGVGTYEGLPYIILEYVEGDTLKDIITNNGPMPPRLAVNLVSQLLEALSAAHRAGIIHRDVKPQNIIVTEKGRVKLTDFGIAREINANTITFSGSTILGSVHYLSPEQAKGKIVTRSSDLYSTGIVLYEILTGTVPFNGENSVTIALMQIKDTPRPPIDLNPKIPPALNDVVLCALQKNPADRYDTAAEMEAHLKRALREPDGTFVQEYMQEKSESAANPSGSRQKIRLPRAHIIIGAAVAAVIALFIGLFFFLRSSTDQIDPLNPVPQLVNVSLEQAKESVRENGFEMEIREFIPSDSVPYNHIILQEPEPGGRAKKGSTIYVTISLGQSNPVVPNLIGKSLDEARALLEEEDLFLGTSEDRRSDLAVGLICAQSIPPGTEVKHRSVINVSVSSEASRITAMPTLVGELFHIAVDTMKDLDCSDVTVRLDRESLEEDGMIIAQTPDPGKDLTAEEPILLTVAEARDFPYFCDVALNLDIPENDTNILIYIEEVYNGFDYKRILLDETIQRGERVPVAFTCGSDLDGMREIVVLVNGTEVRRLDINFARRPS